MVKQGGRLEGTPGAAPSKIPHPSWHRATLSALGSAPVGDRSASAISQRRSEPVHSKSPVREGRTLSPTARVLARAQVPLGGSGGDVQANDARRSRKPAPGPRPSLSRAALDQAQQAVARKHRGGAPEPAAARPLRGAGPRAEPRGRGAERAGRPASGLVRGGGSTEGLGLLQVRGALPQAGGRARSVPVPARGLRRAAQAAARDAGAPPRAAGEGPSAAPPSGSSGGGCPQSPARGEGGSAEGRRARSEGAPGLLPEAHGALEAVLGAEPNGRGRPGLDGLAWGPPGDAGDRARLSINTFSAKSSKGVLQLVAQRLGWAERESSARATAAVHWVVSPEETEERLLSHAPGQRIARVPGMHDLCRKVPFARLMARKAADDPRAFDFHPETVVLPGGAADAARAGVFRSGAAILKPDDGTQGDGIYLVTSVEEARRRMETARMEAAVLQRYIAHPLLLGSFKFDVRVYVLVLSLRPLRIFLCREGLVRVCSIPYERPAKTNLHHAARHLTNYTLNKSNAAFVHNPDPSDGAAGGKRLLSAVLRTLQAQGLHPPARAPPPPPLPSTRPGKGLTGVALHAGVDIGHVWREIRYVCAQGARALADGVLGRVPGVDPGEMWPRGQWRSERMPGCQTQFGDARWGAWDAECFHVLGFDVMLDTALNATLLEVNCNPSMALDEVHSADAARAAEPPPRAPQRDPALEAWMHKAQALCRGRGARVCRCLAHHRPHWHSPCAIDVSAKIAVVGGCMDIVGRDYAAAKQGVRASAETLCAGTPYEALVLDADGTAPPGAAGAGAGAREHGPAAPGEGPGAHVGEGGAPEACTG
jgi:hypothetical protein